MARLVAVTRMSVLILGENGTGKKHIAQHIHALSKQSDKPFVEVDCRALQPSLAQSAFFGHVKETFTGADNDKAGYFQEAEGGTMFLDEVGYLTMETQQMLLLPYRNGVTDLLEQKKTEPPTLLTYPWPGNVRELKQKVLSAVLHTEGDMVTEGELELGNEQTAASAGFTLKSSEEEKDLILQALNQADGNKRQAAKLQGIGRTTRYNKLKENGLEDA